MKRTLIHEIVGEALGTCILVLFGCGAIAVSILFTAHQGLMQIALVWGIGVTLAIYATRHLSNAHLNPAVTLAIVVSGQMSARKIPTYFAAQFLGAVLAGITLLVLFNPSITEYEKTNNIIRGSSESIQTAMIFGEYYPNPDFGAHVTMPHAIAVEALGTFILVLMIFIFTDGCNVGRPGNDLTPVMIGLTVSSIICLLAPLTQAGINPARDLGPRLVAWLAGWNNAAFPDRSGGFFFVYILGPFAGSVAAAATNMWIINPLMKPVESNPEQST